MVTTAIRLYAPDFSTSAKSVANLAGRTPALHSTATSLVNVASVSSSTADLNPADNTAGSTVDVVSSADLVVTKTVADATVVPGASTSYTVTVRNDGPSAAANVVATDAAGPGLTLTEATAPGATCTLTGGAARCTQPTLGPGESLIMTVAAIVSPDASAGQVIMNNATASADTPDPDPTNSAAAASITAGAPQTVVSAAKTSTGVVAGGQVTYSVTIVNAGPSTAAAVSIADVLPAGMSAISAVPTRGTCTLGATIACTLGDLPGPSASGQATTTVTIIAAVPADFAPGPVDNAVVATSPTADPDRTNNAATATTSVSAEADVSVAKQATPTQPAAATTSSTR